MPRFPALLLLFLLWAGSPAVAESGSAVVVVYNSRLPESKQVADYYARKRSVPSGQVLGLKLPITETMSREEFRDLLQTPLNNFLLKKKLFVLKSEDVPATSNKVAFVRWRVAEAKVRYVALCYGVPLQINEAAGIVEPEAEKLVKELRRNEACVESELSLLPLLANSPMLTGPWPNPLYGNTNSAMLNPTNGLLMVTRLDGPTAQIAKSLVDKALLAERQGLWGRAYFDVRSITNGPYKLGDDWIRAAADASRRFGFETIVDEKPETIPATFPMSHIALYAGWYAGKVTGPFALPEVEFMPGAIAYHLHSGSATTLRSSSEAWAGPFLAAGATATLGSVREPYLSGTPDIGTLFGYLLFYGYSFGEAAYAGQATLSWQTTVVGDPLYRPFGRPPQVQHEELVREKSKLAEWSHLRLVNVNAFLGRPLIEMSNYLEQEPLTKTSAVLSEKLGDLYQEQGKPASAIRSYQQALRLGPSPQQQIRLTLGLAEKLTGQSRTDEAAALYREFLHTHPSYPDTNSIAQKLSELPPSKPPPK